MLRLRAVVTVAFIAGTVLAADPARAPLPLRAPVQDKNFYVLSLLEKSKIVAADDALRAIRRAKVDALHNAVGTCALDCACFAAAMKFSEPEIADASAALRRLALDDRALRASGTEIRHPTIEAAWIEAANGINNIIDVYGTGKPPRYAEIDAVSFDVKSRSYGQLVHIVAEDLDEQRGALDLFFEPSLKFAMYLLDINHRDEAGRLEPLDRGANAAAIRRLRTIPWKKFDYSAIIVLGSGTDRLEWSFSPYGKLRCEIAARRFKAGKAPVIIVSGGYVHPKQTPYCEAIEMKKSLIRDFGVPANAIIIEPHARHTTTNLRNAARLMVRYGMPFDHKALVITDSFHSAYVEGEGFAKRCDEELGYQPAKIGRRVSPFDLEIVPRIESLQINPMDPLDP
jgi:hypothetical protein